MKTIDKILGNSEFKYKNFYADWTKDNKYVAIQYTVQVNNNRAENKICLYNIKDKCKHYEILNTPENNSLYFSFDSNKLISYKREFYHITMSPIHTINDNILLVYDVFLPDYLISILDDTKKQYEEWINEKKAATIQESDLLLTYINKSFEDIKNKQYILKDYEFIKSMLYKNCQNRSQIS